jgi:hypothetical protein
MEYKMLQLRSRLLLQLLCPKTCNACDAVSSNYVVLKTHLKETVRKSAGDFDLLRKIIPLIKFFYFNITSQQVNSFIIENVSFKTQFKNEEM